MLPDEVRAFPARPPSEVEWEDLLVRVEIAPRALRIAMEDAPPGDPRLVDVLRMAVLFESQLQHMLLAMIDGREVEEGFGVAGVAGDPAVLVDEYVRLRYRSFLMVQRRGVNVWDWTVLGGEWGGATAYQLFQAAAHRDGVLLASVRRTSRQGAGA
jgi:hypothetical protein